MIEHGDWSKVLIGLCGQITSLGTVYNKAQMIGMRCAAVACLISAGTIWSHLRKNAYPQVRFRIICILFLVPVYTVDAAMGLQFSRYDVPRQLLRQAYEAYVLLCFSQLILLCLEDASVSQMSCIHAENEYNKAVLAACWGIWQYAIICGIVLTTTVLLCWQWGIYHDGRFEMNDTYPYFAFVQFCSQSWALWSMVKLVRLVRWRLARIRPILKFMVIKLIIFFTWVQTVAILLLENVSSLGQISLWIEEESQTTISHWWDPLGVFDSTDVETHRVNVWKETRVRDDIGTGLGNFVLCVEMVAFSIAHCYAYRSCEWDPSHKECALSRLQTNDIIDPLIGPLRGLECAADSSANIETSQ